MWPFPYRNFAPFTGDKQDSNKLWLKSANLTEIKLIYSALTFTQYIGCVRATLTTWTETIIMYLILCTMIGSI